jgi:hypothetical protein
MSPPVLVRAVFGLMTCWMSSLYLGKARAALYRRTGRRFARKTIITHEGPLKQFVRELAFLSGLRYTNIVRLCEGESGCYRGTEEGPRGRESHADHG